MLIPVPTAEVSAQPHATCAAAIQAACCLHLCTDRNEHSCSATDSLECMQEDDQDGVLGVNLSKQLVKVAARVLKTNITRTAPLILPLSQKLAFLRTLLQRKV